MYKSVKFYRLIGFSRARSLVLAFWDLPIIRNF